MSDITNGILTPAYGRDFRSAEKARINFRSKMDWSLNNITSRYDGKYCSIRDCKAGDIVTLRFNKNRSVTTYQVKPKDLVVGA